MKQLTEQTVRNNWWNVNLLATTGILLSMVVLNSRDRQGNVWLP